MHSYIIPRGSLVSWGDGWRPLKVQGTFIPRVASSAIGTIDGQVAILHPVTAVMAFGEAQMLSTGGWR